MHTFVSRAFLLRRSGLGSLGSWLQNSKMLMVAAAALPYGLLGRLCPVALGHLWGYVSQQSISAWPYLSQWEHSSLCLGPLDPVLRSARHTLFRIVERSANGYWRRSLNFDSWARRIKDSDSRFDWWSTTWYKTNIVEVGVDGIYH